MSFRLYSNDDMRITHKEMLQSLQVQLISLMRVVLKR